MLIFNLNEIKKENILNINTINIKINVRDIEMNYFDLYKIFYFDILSQIKDNLKENTVFKINIISKQELTEDDIGAIFDTCVNIICNDFICKKDKRDRETRLTADMKGINYKKIGWLKLINNNTVINNFNIQLLYKNIIMNLIEN